MGKYDAQAQTYDGFHLEELLCYGCVYSSLIEPPPGKPSGADPCHFCVRNRLWRQFTAGMDRVSKSPQWPDGSAPYCVPMDCYCSIDMHAQQKVWITRAEERDSAALENTLATYRKLHPDETD